MGRKDDSGRAPSIKSNTNLDKKYFFIYSPPVGTGLALF